MLGKTIPYTSITIGDLIWALTIFIVGVFLVKITVSALRRSLERLGAPPLVAGIIARLTQVILLLAVALASVSALGISTGSVVISISAVIGLILGFGLQDTMNNLAAGIWLTVIRAFHKGDFVQVSGYKGTVEDVGVLSTKLRLPGGEIAFIPNRSVWGSPIVNYSIAETRRFDFTVGVAYGTDLDKAVRVALEALKSTPGVLQDPAPQVLVWELGDSAINLQVRAWARKEDLLSAKTSAIQRIYEEFEKEGIEIPFPQIDVHIKNGLEKKG
ncbi:MAG: mechanosensitive ion channel family protein [Desulfurococcales archaeon]|nr:mechanosensitive ion channel family protein [Desulfurococcales archaeon]